VVRGGQAFGPRPGDKSLCVKQAGIEGKSTQWGAKRLRVKERQNYTKFYHTFEPQEWGGVVYWLAGWGEVTQLGERKRVGGSSVLRGWGGGVRGGQGVGGGVWWGGKSVGGGKVGRGGEGIGGGWGSGEGEGEVGGVWGGGVSAGVGGELGVGGGGRWGEVEMGRVRERGGSGLRRAEGCSGWIVWMCHSRPHFFSGVGSVSIPVKQ